MAPQSRIADRLAADIAAEQKGLVTRAQLLGAGVSPSAVKHRLRKGSLHVEFPGVYRVGHCAPSVEATYLAAVLACGEEAVLSGLPAAHLWGLITGRAPRPLVTAPTERRVEGIATRRARRLDPRDRGVRHGIPVTSVARTLVDIAAELTFDDLARACHEAGVRYRMTPRQVEAALARKANAKGGKNLRCILRGDANVVLSNLERRFLRQLREIRRPFPQTNRPAGGRYVDCRWSEHGLTVELDSYTFHSSRHAWELDRRREREAYLRGDQFRRYTWGDVFEHPRLMLRELCQLLPELVR